MLLESPLTGTAIVVHGAAREILALMRFHGHAGACEAQEKCKKRNDCQPAHLGKEPL
jgi:hypothetical protein